MKKALAIFTAYYRRLGEAVGKFVASVKGEHRTSNAERRTSKEENASSVPSDTAHAAIEDNSLPAARSTGQRTEMRGFDETEHPTTNIEHSTSNQTDPVSSAQAISGARATSSAFENRPPPGSATVPVASSKPGERATRASMQENAHRESSLQSSELRSPISELPNFITRDELKRELDSLRRLVESRK